MFRLAPLVSCAAAFSDETSLIQGLKPQPTPQLQKEDKSKAISNLLETATSMLKNGATEDVVAFATETLAQITQTVLPAIQSAHDTDQQLVDNTFLMFQAALQELSEGNGRVKTAHDAERSFSRQHKVCRQEEQVDCHEKIHCDYDLWELWKNFVEEEEELRRLSMRIETHFCVEGANGTTWAFRDSAAVLFPPWIDQKPIVETKEHLYDVKVPTCETFYSELETKTEECDGLQLYLDQAACTHYNTVIQVRNLFAASWLTAINTYQRVIDEVHCLEIDRWKEWRTLASVECLIGRTTERNGRPCDDYTDEAETEVLECERRQVDESIDHLRIRYPHVPDDPVDCVQAPWETPPENLHLPYGPCIPVPPQLPCNDGYKAQEYTNLWPANEDLRNFDGELLIAPPQPEFTEENSHCNQHPECFYCAPEAENSACGFLHSLAAIEYPLDTSECHEATRQQFFGGAEFSEHEVNHGIHGNQHGGVFDLDHDGHWQNIDDIPLEEEQPLLGR